MDYQFDFSVIAQSGPDLLLGCLHTLQLSGLSIALALILSLVLSLGLRSRYTVLHWPILGFIEVVRNTPFLVQIFVLYHHAEEIREAGLGADWPAFRSQMATLAREGTCITRGELMTGALGISAPVFDPERKILGSITFAMSEERLAASDEQELRTQIVEASRRITTLIAQDGESLSASSPGQVTAFPPISE